jgi:translocation and assembly module TamB
MMRAHRMLLLVAAVLLALPVVLCSALLVLANTDVGRRLIERSTERLSGGIVLLQGLSGRFPDRLALSHLELRDPQGVWLTADDLQLGWWPLPLIERHAHIGALSAARVSIPRAPAYAPTATPQERSGWWLHALRVDRLDVARLELGAPLAGSAVALRLQGSVRVSSWRAAAGQLTAQRLDQVPSIYRLLAQVDRKRVHVQLDVKEDADGPLTHLIRLPQLGALSVHLAMDGPRDAVATQLLLRGGALQGDARGSVNVDTGAAALQLALDAPSMSPRPDLAWRRLALHGRWSGTLAAPTSSAQLALEGLSSGALELDALNADLHGEGDALALDASVAGLVLPPPMLRVLSAAPLQLHASVRLGAAGRPVDFTLSHPLLSAQGKWSAQGGATLSALLHDLAPVAQLAGVQLGGRGSLQAQLSAAAPIRRLELTAALDITGGDAPLVGLLGPHATLGATLAFRDGSVDIERSQLAAPGLQASLHGRDARGALGLEYQFALPDLAALSPALAGQLQGQGQLRGSTPRLMLTADLQGRLAAHGSPPGALHLSLSARDLPQHPSGRIELSGVLDQAPLVLAASIERNAEGTVAARIERGDWKSAHLAGAVRIDNRYSDPQGRLQLQIAQLRDLDALLGQELQGSLDASVLFDRIAGRSQAHISLDAHDAGIASEQLQVLQLRGDIIEPLLRPVLALQLSAQAELRGAQLKLDTQAHGPLSHLALHSTASLSSGAAPALQLDGAATVHLAHRELQLVALRADYRDQSLHLLAPATLSFGDGLVLGQCRLGVADTVLEVAGRLTPALALTVSLRDFTPALLRVLWPALPAEGRVDADATLTGTLAQPLGSFKLTARALRASNGAARGLPPTDVDASATLQPQGMQLQVQVNAGDGLTLSGRGQEPLNRATPIDFNVTGSFNLNVVNPITEVSGQRMLGRASIDAELGGTLAAPQARGTLVISGGDLQDYPRGTHLSDVSAILAADGGELALKQFTAHAGKGTITASGTLGLGGGDLPVALQLTARGARPFASDLLTATVDMDLTINGGLRSRLNAAGSIKIDRADINIPNALPPDVAVLNVVRPGQAAGTPTKPASTIVDLDVTVAAPRAVFVRGRGIDAELGGKLRIQGSSVDPDISGGFDLANGANSTVNLAGATLTFSTGRVSFNGSGVKKRIDPTLDFTASNTSAGVTANLNVGGYADAPVITLSSTPEMPQDEILSHLLFGVSVTQLSPLQLAQIGAALASMGGVGGGFNPLNAVQRKLGLDRLAVSGGASNSGAATGVAGQTSNAATIEAGRYVTRRIYIGGKQSTNGATQAQVQIDLTKSLKLSTALGTGGTAQGATPQNDPGSSLGLTYQFEY